MIFEKLIDYKCVVNTLIYNAIHSIDVISTIFYFFVYSVFFGSGVSSIIAHFFSRPLGPWFLL